MTVSNSMNVFRKQSYKFGDILAKGFNPFYPICSNYVSVDFLFGDFIRNNRTYDYCH